MTRMEVLEYDRFRMVQEEVAGIAHCCELSGWELLLVPNHWGPKCEAADRRWCESPWFEMFPVYQEFLRSERIGVGFLVLEFSPS